MATTKEETVCIYMPSADAKNKVSMKMQSNVARQLDRDWKLLQEQMSNDNYHVASVVQSMNSWRDLTESTITIVRYLVYGKYKQLITTLLMRIVRLVLHSRTTLLMCNGVDISAVPLDVEEAYDDEDHVIVAMQSGMDNDYSVTSNNEIVQVSATVGPRGSDSTGVVYNSETLNVPSVDLDSVFLRYYKLPGNYAWGLNSTSNVRFKQLAQITLPADFMVLEQIAPQGFTKYHALYRSDFDIMLQLNTTMFTSGALIMFAIPGSATTYDDFDQLNYAAVMQLPHIKIIAGRDTQGVLRVPYGAIFPILSPETKVTAPLARVCVMVWSPLKAQTEDSSASFTLWIKPVDTQLAVKTTATVAQSGFAGSIIKPVTHALLEGRQEWWAHTLKGVGSLFGMYDRVQIDDKHNESYRCADAPLVSINAKFAELEVIPDVESRFKVDRPLTCIERAKVPGLVSAVLWKKNSPTNRPLTTIEVAHLMPGLPSGKIVSGAVEYLAPPLAVMSSMFTYVRGSILMTIEVIAPVIAKGNLFVAFDAYGSTSVSTEAIFGLPGVTMEIGAAQNAVTVKLPYSKHVDYLPVEFRPDPEDRLGTVYVMILNPLIMPVGTAEQVEILIYVQGGDDLEFSVPVTLDRRAVLWKTGGVFHSGLSTEVTEFYESTALPKGFIMGDHTHMLELLRRPEYVSSTPHGSLAGIHIPAGSLVPPYSNIHKFIMQMYKYYSGGIHVHLVTDVTRNEPCIANFSYSVNGYSSDWTFQATAEELDLKETWRGALHNLTVDPCVNFNVPGYFGIPLRETSIPLNGGWTGGNQGAFSLHIQPRTTGTPRAIVGHSVADDFMLYGALPVPRIGITPSLDDPNMLIPAMTVSPIQGISFSSNMTNAFNAVNRNIASGAIFTSTNNSITVIVESGQSLGRRVRAMTILLIGKIPTDMVATITGSVPSSETVEDETHAFPLSTNVGYMTVPFENGHKRYDIVFSGAIVPTCTLNELQLYYESDFEFMPPMTGPNSPATYTVTATGEDISPAWHLFDKMPNTMWQHTGAAPNTMKLISTTPFILTNVELANTWTMGANGYRGWKLWAMPKVDTPASERVFLGSNPPELLANNSYTRVPVYQKTMYHGIVFEGLTASVNEALSYITLHGKHVLSRKRREDHFHRAADGQSNSVASSSGLHGSVTIDAQNGLLTVAAGCSQIFELLKAACSSAMGAFAGVVNGIKRIMGLIKASNDAAAILSISNFHKMAKNVLRFLTSLMNVITGLVTATTAPSAGLKAMGVLSAALAFSDLTKAVNLDKASACESHADDALVMIKTIFNASFIAGCADKLFKRFGFDVDVSRYMRRKMIGCSTPLEKFKASLMGFIDLVISGKGAHDRADDDYNERLCTYMQVCKRLNSLKSLEMYIDSDGTKVNPVDKLKEVVRVAEHLTAESAFVKGRRGSTPSDLWREINLAVEKFRVASNARSKMEPVSVYVTGGSGIGKTLLTAQILPAILNSLLRDDAAYRHVDFKPILETNNKPQDHLSDLVHVYAASKQLKFDGFFRHQPFMIIDDAFTTKNELDAEMITRVVSGAPFEVPKADCADKKEAYDPLFVIINSNVPDPIAHNANYIHDPIKLGRRLGKHIEMTQRVLHKRLSYDDLPITNKLQEYCDYVDNCVRFVVSDFVEDDADQQQYGNYYHAGEWSCRQLVDFLVREFKRKSAFSCRGLDDLLTTDIVAQNGDDKSADNSSSVDPQDGYQSVGEFVLDVSEPILRKPGVAKRIYNFLRIRPRSYTQDIQLDIFTLPDEPVEACTEDSIIDEIVSRSSLFSPFMLRVITQRMEYRGGVEHFKEKLKSVEANGNLYIGLYDQLFPKMSMYEGMVAHIARFKKYVAETHMAIIMSLIGGAAGIGIGMLIHKFVNHVAIAAQSLLGYSGAPEINNSGVFKPVKDRAMFQNGFASKADQEMIGKIRKNILQACWWHEDGRTEVCQYVLCLNANVIVFNEHFFAREQELMTKGFVIRLTARSAVGLTLQPIIVHVAPTNVIKRIDDAVVVKLPTFLPNIRSIAGLMREPSVKRTAVLLGQSPEEDKFFVVSNLAKSVEMNVYDRPGNIVKTVTRTVDALQPDLMQGGERTKFGDCGKPYFVLGHGIMGIHTGGDLYGGVCAYSTRIPATVIDVVPERAFECSLQPAISKYWESETPLCKGMVDGVEMSHWVPTNTKFARLVINGNNLVEDDECDYRPAALKTVSYQVDDKMVLRDPLVSGCQKWETGKTTSIPQPVIDRAITYYGTKFKDDRCTTQLSEHEVINGFGCVSPIDMKTSVGYWGHWFKNGKREVFDPLPSTGEVVQYQWSEKSKNFVIPQFGKTLYDIVLERETQLRAGKIPPFVFLSTMKDELKSAEKVRIGKTRVFEQANIDFVYLQRKYFGRFIDYYKTHTGFKFYHGIGRDKERVWKQYAEELVGFNQRGHAFDFTGFDGSVPSECFYFFRMIVRHFYRDEDPEADLARDGIISAMQNAIHVVRDYVFESVQGNKSGNAFTDVFNSCSNTFLMYVAFMCAQWQAKLDINVAKFDEHVRMLTYGDDIVMTVSDEAHYFNGTYIQRVMSDIGVTVTSAQKTALVDFQPFEELTFLKSHFIYDSGVDAWFAPMPVKDIIKELKYRPRNIEDPTGDLRQRILNVQRFLAHHPKHVFEEWTRRLRSRVPENMHSMFGESYEARRCEIALLQRDEGAIS